MADSHNNTDLVRFNTRAYLSYNCMLEGGGGGGSYFPLATYVRNDNHPSRWAICSQGWNEGSADMHIARKKLTFVSSGCGWNAGWQTYPIRKVLYVGGLCHRQVLPGHH